jgi:hypothetical protein
LDANAPALSAAEARDFFKPGSEVETFLPQTGSVRRWVNDASGKFIASRQGGTRNAKSQGSGEWKVTDNGQYCVVIEWKLANGSPDTAENWCRVAYRFDGETYLAPRDLAANVDKKYSVVRIK